MESLLLSCRKLRGNCGDSLICVAYFSISIVIFTTHHLLKMTTQIRLLPQFPAVPSPQFRPRSSPTQFPAVPPFPNLSPRIP